MKRLRLGMMVLFSTGSAAVALAGEPSLINQTTRAFDTVIKDATGVAASAASQLTGSAKKKRSVGNAETSGDLPLPVRKPKGAQAATAPSAADDSHDDHAADTAGKDDAAAKDKYEHAPTGKPGEATEWPAVDIELAKARCTRLLKDLDVVTVPEAPFRKGACGAPAPVRLVSIGKNPAIAISPPALVTCDLVVALHKWMTSNVQPLAKKYLEAPVVKIETMSDYSCRNAYGRIGGRLSEHGKANALDIRGFVTAKAKTAMVLEEWGDTKRDVAARIAAKEAADKAQAAKAAADETPSEAKAAVAVAEKADAKADAAADAAKATLAKTTIIDGMPKLTITMPGGGAERTAAAGATSISVAPRHLGGPQDQKKGAGKGERASVEPPAVAAPAPLTKTSLFLHEAHDAACRIFGTTLGPEANNDHRNHFHVDMAERKHGLICD